MPIYPYLCQACGHEFERLQKVSDPPLEQCPDCGEKKLRKKLTAAAFHLKGTGWYETDFKDKGAKKDQKDGSATAAKTETKTESKTETKSDGKKSADGGSGATKTDTGSKSESKKAESNG